ncbi:hypothetical protein ACV9TN_001950 [Listeria monocytogenes]|uniref:hypothetical protein n=1 Tax=Listeria monocytogenes TaxID=1639 RepID=UPI000EDA3A94|nr:hypothetical protein [Listeria monocytogenes]EAC2563433.1 hypothetical protein [Listeria monocytogenes]EAD0653811.1 hypothetical protein [Listeria monocytogenes]EAD2083684.1 hypothetical protein [Listeria monocytogenes]EAD2095169.1 hypothetical protein [Listeria monocytogenes]EAD6941071.1 hypothetical protein [Listeria monocytogenes]
MLKIKEKSLPILFQVFIVVVPPFVLGVLGKTNEMTTMMIVSAIAAAVMNFDIKSISAGGLKIEKFREVINEASLTIDNLRRVMVPLSSYVLTTIKDDMAIGYKDAIKVIEGISEANKDVQDNIIQDLLERKNDIIRSKFLFAFSQASDKAELAHEKFNSAVDKLFNEGGAIYLPHPKELLDVIKNPDIIDVIRSTYPDLPKDDIINAHNVFKQNALPIYSDYEKFYINNVKKSQ